MSSVHDLMLGSSLKKFIIKTIIDVTYFKNYLVP